MRSNAISIVVPTLNEADNVALLVQRTDEALKAANIRYEMLFIDDHSTDHTIQEIKALAKTYPIRFEEKVGRQGKSYSLLQGFSNVSYDVICMIDADLQYPPEAIPDMFRMVQDHGADIVITDRHNHKTTFMRKLSSSIFHYVFVQMLFGFDYDTQSGLKIFKKSVIDNISVTAKPWSFDLEFIVRALESNYRIMRFQIPFGPRHSGTAKINLVNSSLELMSESIKLRFSSSKKQLKRAYRSNSRFMEKALNGAALLLVSTVVALFMSGHAKAATLSTVQATTKQAVATTQSVVSQLPQVIPADQAVSSSANPNASTSTSANAENAPTTSTNSASEAQMPQSSSYSQMASPVDLQPATESSAQTQGLISYPSNAESPASNLYKKNTSDRQLVLLLGGLAAACFVVGLGMAAMRNRMQYKKVRA